MARYLCATTEPLPLAILNSPDMVRIVVSLVNAERAEAESIDRATLITIPDRGSLDPSLGPWRTESKNGAMAFDAP